MDPSIVKTTSPQKVAILGASKNPERFSFKAFHMLKDYGHKPYLVTPKFDELDGEKAYHQLSDIKEPIDTLTMYVGPQRSDTLKDQILGLKPKRVIFNPGSENEKLIEELEKNGIHVVKECTLVLLRTNRFDKA